MKKTAISAIIMLFAAFTLSAQGRPQMSPEDMAKRQTDIIKAKVNLNDDQAKKVYDISLKYTKQMAEMRAQGGNHGDRTMFLKHSQERDSLIKKILSPEQIKLYEEYQKTRMQMGPRGNMHNR